MQPSLILPVVAAFVVSLGAALLGRHLGGWRARICAGGPVWLGLAVGLLVLRLTGSATNLVLILLGSALVVGLVETALQLLGVHWAFRTLAALVVLGAAMALEYQRGDLFAVNAAVDAVVGVIVVRGVVFSTRAAQLSGAGRTPPLVALVGAASLLVVALGLPNPGLQSTVLVVAAAVLPLTVLTTGSAELALGPVLAAAAWASGTYAWLANASPAMVVAPVVVVGLDVLWTLTRRLVTAEGRARLGSWGEPADDMVAQRAAVATSVRSTSWWLLGATAAVAVLSLVQWLLTVRWLLAAGMILLLALGWLVLQYAAIRLSRADLMGWLVGLTAVSGLLAVAADLSDGRRAVTVLPLVVMLAIWVAAGPRLLRRAEGSSTPRSRRG